MDKTINPTQPIHLDDIDNLFIQVFEEEMRKSNFGSLGGLNEMANDKVVRGVLYHVNNAVFMHLQSLLAQTAASGRPPIAGQKLPSEYAEHIAEDLVKGIFQKLQQEGIPQNITEPLPDYFLNALNQSHDRLNYEQTVENRAPVTRVITPIASLAINKCIEHLEEKLGIKSAVANTPSTWKEFAADEERKRLLEGAANARA